MGCSLFAHTGMCVVWGCGAAPLALRAGLPGGETGQTAPSLFRGRWQRREALTDEVLPLGSNPHCRHATKIAPACWVRSARKTVQWTVFSGERAAAPERCRASGRGVVALPVARRGYPPAAGAHMLVGSMRGSTFRPDEKWREKPSAPTPC